MPALLLVNFGGPRDLAEIRPFLTELLTDRDVIRTRLPAFLNNWIFRRAARKRAVKIAVDYEKIGGKSPIYFDTEAMRSALSEKLGKQVLSFHRYLPATHPSSLEAIESWEENEIHVLPMFPQFCFATTGSIARFFQNRLSKKALAKLRWVQSYADHPGFISSWQTHIRNFLASNNLKEEETALFCSAHGVPKTFVEEGDPYEQECRLSFSGIVEGFPKALGYLAFQSKFGPGEWLRPYTDEASEDVLSWYEGRKNIVFVPITFTSDHIETLFEIEELYLPVVRSKNLTAFRCPALNLEPFWIEALSKIAKKASKPNGPLVR